MALQAPAVLELVAGRLTTVGPAKAAAVGSPNQAGLPRVAGPEWETLLGAVMVKGAG